MLKTIVRLADRTRGTDHEAALIPQGAWRAARSSPPWTGCAGSVASACPGTAKELGIAEAAAQAAAEPHFLIYWFQEGGWDGYSMFNPVDTPNDATLVIPAGTLNPDPGVERPALPADGLRHGAATTRRRRRGTSPTATSPQDGHRARSRDMAVVSQPPRQHVPLRRPLGLPLRQVHPHALSAERGADERTVMQAFCEAYGANYARCRTSRWHRWLSDGELSAGQLPRGHRATTRSWARRTRTPSTARRRRTCASGCRQIQAAHGERARRAHPAASWTTSTSNFIARQEQRVGEGLRLGGADPPQLAGRAAGIDREPDHACSPTPTLRAEFDVQRGGRDRRPPPSVNGNPARSKETPEHQRAGDDGLRADDQGALHRLLDREPATSAASTRTATAACSMQQQGPDRPAVARCSSDLWTPLQGAGGQAEGHPASGSPASRTGTTPPSCCARRWGG